MKEETKYELMDILGSIIGSLSVEREVIEAILPWYDEQMKAAIKHGYDCATFAPHIPVEELYKDTI
jgi:hypothetical protein